MHGANMKIARHFLLCKCRPVGLKRTLRLSWILICDEISLFRFLDVNVSRSYKLYNVKHVGLVYIRFHARYYSTLRTSMRSKCGVFEVTVSNAMQGAEYFVSL